MHMLRNTYSKSDIYFSSQSCEQDQKNKFRTEDSIGSSIGTKFLDEFEIHHRTLIWSQLAQIIPSKIIAERDIYSRHYLDEGFFEVTKQRLGLQCKLAAQRSS
jgi:hypothetical protein